MTIKEVTQIVDNPPIYTYTMRCKRCRHFSHIGTHLVLLKGTIVRNLVRCRRCGYRMLIVEYLVATQHSEEVIA